MQKVFGRSLLRSTWRIYGASGEEIARAREHSPFVSLIRRFVGPIPVEFLGVLPIPYHFGYFLDDHRIGGLERILGIRDRGGFASRAIGGINERKRLEVTR